MAEFIVIGVTRYVDVPPDVPRLGPECTSSTAQTWVVFVVMPHAV